MVSDRRNTGGLCLPSTVPSSSRLRPDYVRQVNEMVDTLIHADIDEDEIPILCAELQELGRESIKLQNNIITLKGALSDNGQRGHTGFCELEDVGDLNKFCQESLSNTKLDVGGLGYFTADIADPPQVSWRGYSWTAYTPTSFSASGTGIPGAASALACTVRFDGPHQIGGHSFSVPEFATSSMLDINLREVFCSFVEKASQTAQRLSALIQESSNSSWRHGVGLANRFLDCGTLREFKDLSGINTPREHVSGGPNSASPMHIEAVNMGVVHMVLVGNPQVWLIVPPSQRTKLERFIRSTFANSASCAQFVSHLSLILSPDLLDEWNIGYNIVACPPWRVMVILPGAYHQALALGPSVAEAVSFAQDGWTVPNSYRWCGGDCPDHALQKKDFVLKKDAVSAPKPKASKRKSRTGRAEDAQTTSSTQSRGDFSHNSSIRASPSSSDATLNIHDNAGTAEVTATAGTPTPLPRSDSPLFCGDDSSDNEAGPSTARSGDDTDATYRRGSTLTPITEGSPAQSISEGFEGLQVDALDGSEIRALVGEATRYIAGVNWDQFIPPKEFSEETVLHILTQLLPGDFETTCLRKNLSKAQISRVMSGHVSGRVSLTHSIEASFLIVLHSLPGASGICWIATIFEMPTSKVNLIIVGTDKQPGAFFAEAIADLVNNYRNLWGSSRVVWSFEQPDRFISDFQYDSGLEIVYRVESYLQSRYSSVSATVPSPTPSVKLRARYLTRILATHTVEAENDKTQEALRLPVRRKSTTSAGEGPQRKRAMVDPELRSQRLVPSSICSDFKKAWIPCIRQAADSAGLCSDGVVQFWVQSPMEGIDAVRGLQTLCEVASPSILRCLRDVRFTDKALQLDTNLELLVALAQAAHMHSFFGPFTEAIKASTALASFYFHFMDEVDTRRLEMKARPRRPRDQIRPDESRQTAEQLVREAIRAAGFPKDKLDQFIKQGRALALSLPTKDFRWFALFPLVGDGTPFLNLAAFSPPQTESKLEKKPTVQTIFKLSLNGQKWFGEHFFVARPELLDLPLNGIMNDTGRWALLHTEPEEIQNAYKDRENVRRFMALN